MPKRLGKQTVAIESNVSIISSAAIVGQKEGEGPLAYYFDTIFEDAEWGEESWEKTENKIKSHEKSGNIF